MNFSKCRLVSVAALKVPVNLNEPRLQREDLMITSISFRK